MTTSESRRELIDLTVALSRINSVNSTLDPTAPGEAEVGAFVRDWMTNRGWRVHEEWPAPSRPNIVGVISGGDGPTLMVNAHLDTVGASPGSFEIRLTDDTIHGRGVLDTKGGLAAALMAADSFSEDLPPGDVIIAAVSDEEADSIGTSHLLEGWLPDAAIVIEPTDLAIITGHRGFGILELTYTGRAAHTGHREEGLNAIEPAARLVTTLERLESDLRITAPHPQLGFPSIQVTRIHGGRELFTVPELCSASIEIRSVPGREAADVHALVSVLESQTAGGFTVDYEWIVMRPPFEVNTAEPIVEAMSSAVAHSGVEPFLRSAPFWTDAALFAGRNIPAVVFGPGGNGIHSDDEWLRVDDLVSCYDTLRHAMANFGNE